MTLRVGVLTGGGDAPGLNAAICGLGRRVTAAGGTLLGFRDGFRGLMEDDAMRLDDFHHLLVHGGTVLGSSSAHPYRDPGRDLPRVRATFARRKLQKKGTDPRASLEPEPPPFTGPQYPIEDDEGGAH